IRAVLRLVGIGDKTEQKVGKAVDVSVLFAGNGREVAGEEIVAVLVARQEGDVVLVTAPDVLESGFETVRALQPREVVSDLEREILLYARMSELIGGAAEEIADVEHGHAAETVLWGARKAGDAEAADDRIAGRRLGEILDGVRSRE